MVVTRPYYVDEDTTYQRGNSRNYSAAEEASTPTSSEGNINGSRSFKFSSKEQCGNQRDTEAENNNSQPRRRIPVACVRCRKRKIRCSGDPGNGGACINCRTAGHEACQFLRVSSREAPLKLESSEFPYPCGASRHSPYRMMDLGVYGHQTLGPQMALEAESRPAYRTGPILAHSFSNRNAYATMIPYGASYADGSVDYNLESNTYQVPHTHQVGFPQPTYDPSGAVRHWIPTQSRTPSSSLFLEPESSYHPGPPPYQNDIIGLQNTNGAETEAFSTGGLQSSIIIPTQVTSSDRVLPFPLPNRPVPLTSQPSKTPENGQQTVIQGHSRQMQGEIPCTSRKALKSNIDNTLMSMPHTYYPVPSSQDYPPSPQLDGLPSYNTNTACLFRDSNVRTESTDMSYGYGTSSGSSKRGSNSTQGSSDGSLSTLANGQQYVPHVQPSYPPQPPIIEIGTASVRRAVENLQTV